MVLQLVITLRALSNKKLESLITPTSSADMTASNY